MHGHLIGGTGAVELLACIMALRDGVELEPVRTGGTDTVMFFIASSLSQSHSCCESQPSHAWAATRGAT